MGAGISVTRGLKNTVCDFEMEIPLLTHTTILLLLKIYECDTCIYHLPQLFTHVHEI